MPRYAPNRMPAAVKRRYFELIRIVVAAQPRRGPGCTPLQGWSMSFSSSAGGPHADGPSCQS